MSELTAFAEHARAMAAAAHKPDCGASVSIHWSWKTVRPDPACDGCVSIADRMLWTQIADETEAYLRQDEDEGLFA